MILCSGKNSRALLLFLIFLLFFLLSAASDLLGETIHSRAAIVIDVATQKILYSKNPNIMLPPASTAKLMTAVVAVESKNASDIITISKNASKAHPSKAGFKEGDRVSVEGLLYAALVKSANDAAIALSEGISGSEKKFVSLMNKKAYEIGARNTEFINSTGLPNLGQHTTAFDLSIILRYAMGNPKLREILGTRVARISTRNGKRLSFRNTDNLLRSDRKIVGGKTGYTASAMHCFVCEAGYKSKQIIIALLGCPSRKTLWAETERLILKIFGKTGKSPLLRRRSRGST
jgi:D-alanyl-D-alanine carboxypeptidase (penicillin-binding protein 5/6)